MNIRTVIVTLLSVGLVALTGCTGDTGGESAPESQSTGVGHPFTLENCGTEVTYEQAPERAVALSQTASEILIALGVGDRVVGKGYETDVPPADIAEEYEQIPLLADLQVPHETLLEAQPDFVYSQNASFFTADQSGERDELHALGVPTYLSEYDCEYHAMVDDVSFEILFNEYEELGRIFGVPEQGERLANEQREVIAAGLETAKNIEGTPTLAWFYSTYDGAPYMAGPGGLPQHVTELLGAKNIFDDASTKWPETSWDEVAARNPDVIVIADLTRGKPGDSAAEKIEMLKTDALTSQLDAVKNDRFIVIAGRNMDPSYASVYAVPEVAEGLVSLQQ